jgi:hypothetical protein
MMTSPLVLYDDVTTLYLWLCCVQGMNLTGADTVIIFDGDWSPHADSYAP